MNEVPLGWAEAQIRELCTLENGRAFKPTDWTDHGLPIVRIQNLNREGASFNHFAGEVVERYRLRGGELLFAWSGTPGTSFGAHIWRGGDAVLNQHIFRVDFDDSAVDKRFFRHAINQKLDELIDVAHGGVGLRHVTKGVFENTTVLVPPLPEQVRIANKLDAILARVDACSERLGRLPVILKRFRQSVLTAATSGKLTEDWRIARREESAAVHDADWQEKPLSHLCDNDRVITYGVIKLGAKVPDGVPCLRTSNVRWLRVDTEGMKRIEPALSAEYGRTVLRGGEVLVNVRGTLCGVAVVSPAMVGWNVSREVAVVPADASQINPSYLSYCIGSEASQQWLGRVEKGVTYIGINIEDLRNLPVKVPSLAEQLEIVERVEALHTYADRVELRYLAASTHVERLRPALLAKAFRGELVSHDPNDEPASLLLERIRAGRVAKPIKTKQRKTGNRSKIDKVEVTMLSRKNTQDTPHLTTILSKRGRLTAEALWAASELHIDDFYDQLKEEEERGLLKEWRSESPAEPRLLEVAA